MELALPGLGGIKYMTHTPAHAYLNPDNIYSPQKLFPVSETFAPDILPLEPFSPEAGPSRTRSSQPTPKPVYYLLGARSPTPSSSSLLLSSLELSDAKVYEP